MADTVKGMYRAFASSDANGVCAAMSSRARRQIAQQVIGGSTVSPENRTCVASFGKFLRAAASAGMLEQLLAVEVSDVSIDGDSAVATISLAGTVGRLRLIREDGAWRFGRPPTAPTGS